MPDFDVSKWPPVYQALAAIGAMFAGAAVWLLGSRGKSSSGETSDRTQAKLDTAELRLDLEEVLRANRETFYTRIKELSDEVKADADALEKRVRQNEIDIAVLKGPAGGRHR